MQARGKRGTIKESVGHDPGYYRLNEFPGIVIHESFLLPFDDSDDAAFDRFMNKIDLTTPLNPWTENID